MIGGISSSAPSYISPSLPTAKAQATGGIDTDGDNDAGSEGTESAAAQASETAKSQSLPTDPNRGRLLNISA